MTLPIDVISLGTGSLGDEARSVLQDAATVIGSQRQLDLVSADCQQAERLVLPSPVDNLSGMLNSNQPQPVVVLASGDALFYGIGSMLIKQLGRDNLRFHPNYSSIQAAMHLIGLPWQNARIVSLHGRPGSSLRRHLLPQTLLGIFTDADNHPAAIAAEIATQGLGDATIWVAEALGTGKQKVGRFTANQLAADGLSFDPLNLVIVKTTKTRGDLPVFPGIADHLFSTGSAPGFGMISKREVRLTLLSLLQPAPGQIAWDIGAGCGSVSVEWARWNPQGTIYAIETEPDRTDHIRTNAERFGVQQNCRVIEGNAPDHCDALPDPDSVFIGGSSGNLSALLDYSWTRLSAAGVLVASAVTDESMQILDRFADRMRSNNVEIEWCEIAVRKTLPDSAETRSLKPVQLVKALKP